MIKGRIFNPPDSVGKKIAKDINVLISAMVGEYRRSVEILFSGGCGARMPVMDAVDGGTFADQATIVLNSINDNFSNQFEFKSSRWAEDLMAGVLSSSDAQVRMALKDISADITLPTTSIQPGGVMADTFQALTQESAELFKTIAPQYFNDVQAAVMRSIVSGNGMQDLKPFFESHSNGTKNYAQLRAMDQTRKAFAGLSRARLQSVGIQSFEWIHTGGGKHPRKLHQELNRKVFRFDDPPFIGVMYGQDVYGFPGDLPNCRCRLRAVIIPDKN